MILALVMVLALAACGGDDGPDVSALTTSYNELATNYNAMIEVATANGWEQDVDTSTKLNTIAEQINNVKGISEDPSSYTQEDIDKLTSGCNDLNKWTADMQAVVAVPYGAEEASGEWPYADFTEEQFTEYTSLVSTMTDMYNEILLTAQENGWEADETTAQEIQTVYAMVAAGQESAADPSALEGTADMEGVLQIYRETLDALPALQEKVSAPYAG